MCCVKEVKEDYREEQDVRNVINYIAQLSKSQNLVSGGNGIISADELHSIAGECIVRQFLAVQALCSYRCKRIYHVVVSFDKTLDNLRFSEIRAIAEDVMFLYRGYQAVYALHEDTYNRHLHIVFNNIGLEQDKNLSSYFNILEITNVVEKKLWEIIYRG